MAGGGDGFVFLVFGAATGAKDLLATPHPAWRWDWKETVGELREGEGKSCGKREWVEENEPGEDYELEVNRAR